jgi:hypothetical protein
MGRIKDNSLLPFSGRIGNVVSCYRYGRYYLRTLPEKVNQPDTEKQLAQRMRFNLVQSFLKPIKPFIRAGFAAGAIGRSAYNAAMSQNLLHAVVGEYPDLRIDFSKALVSKGTLPAAAAAMMAVDAAQVTFSWESEAEDTSGMHFANAVLIAPELHDARWQMYTARRKDGRLTMPVPAGWHSRQLAGYLTFFDEQLLSRPPHPAYISNSILAQTQD